MAERTGSLTNYTLPSISGILTGKKSVQSFLRDLSVPSPLSPARCTPPSRPSGDSSACQMEVNERMPGREEGCWRLAQAGGREGTGCRMAPGFLCLGLSGGPVARGQIWPVLGSNRCGASCADFVSSLCVAHHQFEVTPVTSRCLPALEATQGQNDSFFSQLPYKCHHNRVASVGD